MPRAWSLARIVSLVVFAAACAFLSNLLASTDRKLAWVGSYPRALEVGAPSAPATAAPSNAPAPTVPAARSTAVAAVDSGKVFAPHPDKASVEVSPDDVLLLFGRKALFLDARRSSVYAEGHIAGARSMPVWESDVDARVKALFEEGLDQQAPIVIYCSGGNCEDSHMLAEKLYMVGFDNLLIYKDGFPDWEKRGQPISKGTSP
jgi:rhodanese-related sulfurtransferase